MKHLHDLYSTKTMHLCLQCVSVTVVSQLEHNNYAALECLFDEAVTVQVLMVVAFTSFRWFGTLNPVG